MMTRNLLPSLLTGGMLLLMVVLSGCRSTAFDVLVAGTDNQNQCENQDGGFNTTVVVLELANEVSFLQGVSRQEFWENQAALGSDELGRMARRLSPGETWAVNKFKPRKETTYIGVAANLNCPDGEAWRLVRPKDELRGKAFQIEVREDRVSVFVR